MTKRNTFVVIALVVISVYFFMNWRDKNTSVVIGDPNGTQATTSIMYRNDSYGFSLTLSKDWLGYKVTDVPIQYGKTVTLRHPLWTQANPYMDIPILVYPIAQWQIWEKNNFEGYPTAAPIGPTERGRNANYVFATAPRYNFSFATGWEEVEATIKTLKGF